MLFSYKSLSQKVDVINKISDPNLIISQHEDINKIINSYNNLHYKQLEVFKIQLYNHEDRYRAWKIKKEYETLFPKENIEWEYDQPYFKVKTNYFTTRISAEKKLDSIKNVFPNSFIIKEFIPLKEF